MEIIWTKLAKITYFEIIENLGSYWSNKEITEFNTRTNNAIKNIKSGLITHKIVDNDVRKCILHKNISLFYKEYFTKNKIVLITFFNNKMNPKTLIKLLK